MTDPDLADLAPRLNEAERRLQVIPELASSDVVAGSTADAKLFGWPQAFVGKPE
jgi:hypothetical protein